MMFKIYFDSSASQLLQDLSDQSNDFACCIDSFTAALQHNGQHETYQVLNS